MRSRSYRGGRRRILIRESLTARPTSLLSNTRTGTPHPGKIWGEVTIRDSLPPLKPEEIDDELAEKLCLTTQSLRAAYNKGYKHLWPMEDPTEFDNKPETADFTCRPLGQVWSLIEHPFPR